MPSEVSTVTGDQSLEALRRELVEVREQHAATAGILAAITNSPTDAQRVFAEIAASAARLCDAYDAALAQVDGDVLRIVAHAGPIPVVGIVPIARGVVMGRAVIERQIVHIADVQAERVEYPEGCEWARRLGHRAMVAVPLDRAGEAIGVIALRRMQKRPFSDRQIALLKTFADQAVIAIENTRLFEAEQVSKRELAVALEQQTATSEVLRVISNSPTNVRPVLDAVVRTAATLCASYDAVILLRDGDTLRIAAHHGPMALDFERIPLRCDSVAGRVVVDRVPVHVHDLAAEGEDFPLGRLIAARLNQRTVLGLPLLREGQAIGCLFLRRTEVRPFTEEQIALLQTFADQAVIAIENTRLFEAEQTSKRELQESLEYQTATSEVLNVISRSPTDAQPVFGAIVESAARLCDAAISVVWLYDGELLYYAASHNFTTEVLEHIRKTYPKKPDRSVAAGRAILDCRINHVPDMLADSAYAHDLAMAGNWRASAAVPMLRDGRPIGRDLHRKIRSRALHRAPDPVAYDLCRPSSDRH
jgi:GAF domain-containing protein